MLARRIFLSYSHDDRAWRDAFRQMLRPALDRHGVEFWADDHIFSGDRWERATGDALAGAALGLLLVTAAYLESSFSWQVEVPVLIRSGVPIVWVLVEDCLWDDNDVLRGVQGLQDPARDGALIDHPNLKKEMARICRKVRDEHLRDPKVAAPQSHMDRPPPSASAVSPISWAGLDSRGWFAEPSGSTLSDPDGSGGQTGDQVNARD